MTVETARKFIKFHKDNPIVYELFKKFTAEAVMSGHKKMSSDMICHRIRWEAMVNINKPEWNTATGRPLKINNNHTPYYARLFVHDYPHLKDLFSFRDVK